MKEPFSGVVAVKQRNWNSIYVLMMLCPVEDLGLDSLFHSLPTNGLDRSSRW